MNASNTSLSRPPLLAALRGPVLMIALGALFAVEYAGGPGFGRTWPALLILLGLFKLIEYMGARKT